MKRGIIQLTKDAVKNDFGVDIAVIQISKRFHIIEEDAQIIHDELGYELFPKGSVRGITYDMCCPMATMFVENSLINHLSKLGYSYAILRQVKFDGVIKRQIIYSSNKQAVGKQY